MVEGGFEKESCTTDYWIFVRLETVNRFADDFHQAIMKRKATSQSNRAIVNISG